MLQYLSIFLCNLEWQWSQLIAQQKKWSFVRDVNVMTVQSQTGQSRHPTSPPTTTPSAIVPPHHISRPKRLLLYPSGPWNRLLCSFPGKNARPLIPHAKLTELAEGASTHPPSQSPTHRPSHPPSHTGCNEAALISFVWVCLPLGWFMFLWYTGWARVHVARNHTQRHAQHLQTVMVTGSFCCFFVVVFCFL